MSELHLPQEPNAVHTKKTFRVAASAKSVDRFDKKRKEIHLLGFTYDLIPSIKCILKNSRDNYVFCNYKFSLIQFLFLTNIYFLIIIVYHFRRINQLLTFFI